MKNKHDIAQVVRFASLPVVAVFGFLAMVVEVGAAGSNAKGPERAVQRYCTNVRDIASEARFLWQHKQLQELGDKIDKKIAELRRADEGIQEVV